MVEVTVDLVELVVQHMKVVAVELVDTQVMVVMVDLEMDQHILPVLLSLIDKVKMDLVAVAVEEDMVVDILEVV